MTDLFSSITEAPAPRPRKPRGPMERPKLEWTPVRVKALSEYLCDKGLSARRTADELTRDFGVVVTANMVEKMKAKHKLVRVVALDRKKRKGEANWTDEATATLERMYLAGATWCVIAKELGPWCSPGAVGGKVRRLKLPQRARPKQACLVKEKVPRIRAKRVRSPRVKGEKAPKPAKPAIVVPDVIVPVPVADAPTGALDAVMGLRFGMCKWPMNEPSSDDFRFCCASTEGHDTYCPGHRQVAYRPHPKKTGKRFVLFVTGGKKAA